MDVDVYSNVTVGLTTTLDSNGSAGWKATSLVLRV